MKKLMIGSAVSALMISAAFAQAPATDSGAAMRAPSTAATSATMSAPQFITSQGPDQMLASKFKGTDVVGADDAKIGDVSDLLFDKDGKVEAFVVSVGGFLGVGAKDVAIAPQAFQIIKGTNTAPDKLKLSATKDQLKQAQNFQPYQGHGTTTGMGSSTTPRPMAPAGSR